MQWTRHAMDQACGQLAARPLSFYLVMLEMDYRGEALRIHEGQMSFS
ncbi:MAG: hypothetical protein ACI87E_000625 [Mariniblastus sp.]|jgi:hypothetical protein